MVHWSNIYTPEPARRGVRFPKGTIEAWNAKLTWDLAIISRTW